MSLSTSGQVGMKHMTDSRRHIRNFWKDLRLRMMGLCFMRHDFSDHTEDTLTQQLFNAVLQNERHEDQ
jgi:hypothetical protein